MGVLENNSALGDSTFDNAADFLDDMGILLCVTDKDRQKVLFINESARQYLPWREDSEIEGETCPWRPPQQPGEEAGYLVAKNWEFQDVVTDRWFLVNDSQITWMDGRPAHMGVAVEITELKMREDRLLHYASIDIMTGAFNREWGYSVLKEGLKKSRQSRVISCLCFMDLDGLKDVNDTYGHDEGDNLITSFVAAIKSSCRGGDILCRWGGDEFLLCLQNCERAQAIKLISRIEAEFDETRKHESRPYPHKFSYGVIEVKPRSRKTNLDKLIAKADEQMYINKNSKRTDGLHAVS